MTTKARKPRKAKAKALQQAPAPVIKEKPAPLYLLGEARTANYRAGNLVWAAHELMQTGSFDTEPDRISAIIELLACAEEAALKVTDMLDELESALP